MKFKTTQKAVKEGYGNIIKTGYCNLQYLLYYQKPVAYTAGVYGWNADIYDIGCGVAICTGYRPFGNVEVDCELLREYNKKAEKIVLSWNEYKHNEKLKILDELLNEFIEKVLGEDEE